MLAFLKKALPISLKDRLKRLASTLIVPLFHPTAWLLKTLVPANDAYPVFSKHGYHLLRKHFYLPIPDVTDLSYEKNSELVGIDMNETRSFDLLDNIISPYKQEFNAFPIHAKMDDPTAFYLTNGEFMAVDGNVYYAFVRHYKPRRIVEIGSGNSTLLAAAAIRRNNQNSNHLTDLICIEPYPPPSLRGDIPELTRLFEKKVQEVDISVFQSLQDGDILFIDSSHVLRSGGDVWWEYCEILPRLAPGVLVHIHDIALPAPYERVYFERHFYWNEQYLLQAFLTYNSHFEVLWAGNYLMQKHYDKMRSAFLPEYDLMRKEFPLAEPSSMWICVREEM